MALSRSSPNVSDHAARRMAQRNLTETDIQYVMRHGRRIHNGSAIFVHLGRRDIPADDLRNDRLRRLEGTVLVLDAGIGQFLTTAYRNRQSGMREIKRKRKYRVAFG